MIQLFYLIRNSAFEKQKKRSSRSNTFYYFYAVLYLISLSVG